jgi:predicted enzyme related to lactoylglutathione lyase
MFLGLRTHAVYVPPERLSEAKAWYSLVAGAPPYFDEPFYVGFSIGGYELGLQPDGGRSGAGGVDVFWGTADIDAEVARLVSLGATVADPIQDVGGEIKVAVVSDPFGNRLGVIFNPHFKPSES